MFKYITDIINNETFPDILAVAYQGSGSCWRWGVAIFQWTRSARIKDMERATHIINDIWHVRIHYETELSTPPTVMNTF